MESKVEELVVRVKVRCRDLPGRKFENTHPSGEPSYEPVHLGIQRGREVIEQVPADVKQATFIAEFRVGQRKDGSPNFLGPFAQGTADDRFFYLAWGVSRPGCGFATFRRLKVRLGHLTWKQLRAAAKSGEPIVVDLRLTDARGGPLCATPPKTHIRWDGE